MIEILNKSIELTSKLADYINQEQDALNEIRQLLADHQAYLTSELERLKNENQ